MEEGKCTCAMHTGSHILDDAQVCEGMERCREDPVIVILCRRLLLFIVLIPKRIPILSLHKTRRWIFLTQYHSVSQSSCTLDDINVCLIAGWDR